jgi:hypothetical protein
MSLIVKFLGRLKMKSLALFISMSLFITSCSSWQPIVNYQEEYARVPSSAGVTVDDVMSFKISGNKGTKDYKSEITSLIQSAFNGKFTTVMNESKSLPKDIAFKIELDVIDSKYVVRVLYSAEGFFHPESMQALYNMISAISKSGTTPFNTPYSVFEMYYNARERDLESLDNFLKMRANTNASSIGSSTGFELGQDIEEVKAMRESLAPEIKKLNKDRKVKEAARKAIMDQLDKASQDEQLKSLVARNDRAAVADLLKKYLPYEDMAPFEKRFWDQYIEVIRHPLPHQERILVYRGIDDDFIHQAVIDGVEVDKEASIKEGKAFLMSTGLVKNQGSWNRRLRSLESMNEKFIATVNNSSEYARSARISTIFKQHSKEAKGSPFLSFTPNIGVASNFGYKRTSAFLLDPRVIQYNYTSGFESEKEFLAGLITFPDDLVGIWSTDYNSGIDKTKFFNDKLAELVEAKYGKTDKDAIIKEIEKNTYDYFSPVYKMNNSAAPPKSTWLGSMADFFKKFVKGKNEPLPAVNSAGDLSCDELVKSFWTKK